MYGRRLSVITTVQMAKEKLVGRLLLFCFYSQNYNYIPVVYLMAFYFRIKQVFYIRLL